MDYNYHAAREEPLDVNDLRANLPQAGNGAFNPGKPRRRKRKANKKTREEQARKLENTSVVSEDDTEEGGVSLAQFQALVQAPPSVQARAEVQLQESEKGKQKLSRRQRKLATQNTTDSSDSEAAAPFTPSYYAPPTHVNPPWASFAANNPPPFGFAHDSRQRFVTFEQFSAYGTAPPSLLPAQPRHKNPAWRADQSQQPPSHRPFHPAPERAQGFLPSQHAQPFFPIPQHPQPFPPPPPFPLPELAQTLPPFGPPPTFLLPQQPSTQLARTPPMYIKAKQSRKLTHSPAYDSLTKPAAKPLSQPQPLLVVLDLNGTLLARSKGSSSNPTPRPGLKSFLDYCFATHFVMVWTSARPENMTKMLDAILTPTQWGALLAAWGRDTFGLTAHQYNQKVEVVKDLDKVWATEHLQQEHPWRQAGWSWGVGNTVLVDDTAVKAVRQPWNLMEVPEFTKERLRMEEDGGEGKVLGRLRGYLDEIMRVDNVAGYMRQRPLRW